MFLSYEYLAKTFRFPLQYTATPPYSYHTDTTGGSMVTGLRQSEFISPKQVVRVVNVAGRWAASEPQSPTTAAVEGGVEQACVCANTHRYNRRLYGVIVQAPCNAFNKANTYRVRTDRNWDPAEKSKHVLFFLFEATNGVDLKTIFETIKSHFLEGLRCGIFVNNFESVLRNQKVVIFPVFLSSNAYW